jgi:hypothetical protein
LSVIEQDKHRSEILPFNRDEPKNFWITRNIDFTRWESANDSQALLVSAPRGYRKTEVCSHIIDLAREKAASQTNSSVLYFFSSTATEATRSTAFTHTLLCQIVSCSPRNADSIAATFLNTLLGGHLRQHSQAFRKSNPLHMILNMIQEAPDNELIEALAKAIKIAGTQELSIIVDDLWGDIHHQLVNQFMEAVPKLKALFTSQQSLTLGELPDGMLCIEYDKERKGSTSVIR